MTTRHGGARRCACEHSPPFDRRPERQPGLPKVDTGGDSFFGLEGAGSEVRDAELRAAEDAEDAGEMDLAADADDAVGGQDQPSEQAGLFFNARSGSEEGEKVQLDSAATPRFGPSRAGSAA